MINNYPYTDFHELNLDWFLEQFKGLVADWEQFKTDLTADWDDVKGDWIALKTWVENYFNNLDVYTEISAKLDAMLLNGDLDAPIASAAGDWLSDNLATPSTPPIDTTLSVASAAADAKVVGDTFKLAITGEGAPVTTLNPFLADADNADVNSVYVIANSSVVSNLPADADDTGTLLTYSYDDSQSGGNAQVYIDASGDMYHRERWGATPGTWSDWKLTSNGCLIRGEKAPVTTGNPFLADADDADVNSVYVISNTNIVSNLPTTANDTGTLMTISYGYEQSGGNAQIYIDSNNYMYHRIRWGAFPGTWGAWKLTSNGFQVKGRGKAITSGNPVFTDANNADMNNVDLCMLNTMTNLPANANYAGTLMTYSFSDTLQGGNTQTFIDNYNSMFYRMRWGTAPGTWKKWQQVNQTISPMSMFESAAVIGDSFASGAILHNGVVTEYYNLAWLNILARKNGIQDVGIYAKGGLSSATWLTNAMGSAAMLADTPKQIYFIALGINDYGTSVPVGTYADFTASPHPATFYGNLGEIHDQILTVNPDALVCWITCMRVAGTYANYTNAIVDIATNQNEMLIDCRDIPYFYSPFYTSSLASNHPVSYSYAGIAYEIEKALTDAMATTASVKDFVW